MNRALPLNTSPLPLPLRVEDYLLLDEAGAFGGYSKTELIDGEIVYVNAQHRPHGFVKMEFYDRLRDGLRSIGSPLRPLVETSVAMPPHDAPEPDIVLTSEPRGEGLIPLDSVALIVEVSDTTIEFDLGAKAELYARHGVAEYWVAAIEARALHQHWTPREGDYAHRRVFPFGDLIAAATIDRLEIDTSGI